MGMPYTKLMRIARNASSEKTVPEAGAPGEGAAGWQSGIKRDAPSFEGAKTLTEEAAATAAAEKKDDPDPVTAISTAEAEAIIMFTSTSASVVAATAAAAQNQNQPDNIASGSSCVTIAVAVTAAVCCCQIAHTNSSNNYLQFIICRAACHCFRFFGKFLERFVLPKSCTRESAEITKKLWIIL